MKNLLNDFILSLFHSTDTRVLEKKLNLWKEELSKEKQEMEELKLKYMQTHENPRKDYEEQEKQYLDLLTQLRNNYTNATDVTMKAHLYTWLKESQNIPDSLYTKKSSIYTYHN